MTETEEDVVAILTEGRRHFRYCVVVGRRGRRMVRAWPGNLVELCRVVIMFRPENPVGYLFRDGQWRSLAQQYPCLRHSGNILSREV